MTDHLTTCKIWKTGSGKLHLRMLIDEGCGVVDLVVNHEPQVLLPRMLLDLRICDLLGHLDCCLIDLLSSA